MLDIVNRRLNLESIENDRDWLKILNDTVKEVKAGCNEKYELIYKVREQGFIISYPKIFLKVYGAKLK